MNSRAIQSLWVFPIVQHSLADPTEPRSYHVDNQEKRLGSLTRSTLVARLVQRSKYLSSDDIRLAVNVLLTELTAQMAAGTRIEIRGFGSFGRRLRKSRLARNPRTGEKIYVTAKFIPMFRMAKNLRIRLNRPPGPREQLSLCSAPHL